MLEKIIEVTKLLFKCEQYLIHLFLCFIKNLFNSIPIHVKMKVMKSELKKEKGCCSYLNDNGNR